jgi:hypothetical protein
LTGQQGLARFGAAVQTVPSRAPQALQKMEPGALAC